MRFWMSCIMINRTSLLTLCSAGLFTVGCLHPKIGPHSLPHDRADYSIALSESWKEQTLLNIVKFRYVDPPVFVDVGSIVSSYSLSQNAAAGGTFVPSGSNSANIGGSVAFSNSPTITYTPLTGNAYVKGLITPLPPLLVFAAIQNGSPADLILLASVTSINGLRNQSVSLEGFEPADAGFHRVRELMRKIQDSGAVQLYVKVDPDKQQTNVITFRSTDIAPDIRADILELRRLLHLKPDATELKLVAAPQASSDTEIAVQTRSIMQLLATMAAQVEVPPEDNARHRAFPGFETGRPVPGIVPEIRIQSAKKKPEDSFVSINYRNNWYWIDDGDLLSKRSFAQLMQLFTMTDTGGRENQPVLTIPTR
jgi:hypothetical protein